MAVPSENMLDPMAELNIPREVVKSVVNIHFSSRKVTKIHPNFQKFISLEALWVSNNKLRKIENLVPSEYGGNTTDVADRVHSLGTLRLRALYCSNNLLSTLSGDLRHLRFLEVLLLANNKLSNMELVSSFLRHLQFLKQLDLFGNPLAEEQHYREYYIYHHGSLVILDRLTISEEEVAASKKRFGPSGTVDTAPRIAFGKAVPKASVGYRPPKVNPIAESVQVLDAMAARLRQRQAAEVKRQQQEEVRLIRELNERRARFRVPSPQNDDVVEVTFRKHRARRAQAVQETETAALITLLIPKSDMMTLTAAYEDVKTLSEDDTAQIMNTLGVTDGQALETVQDLAAEVDVLTLGTFLPLLTKVPDIAVNRVDRLQRQSCAAILQGRNRDAQQWHKDINVLTAHIESLNAAAAIDQRDAIEVKSSSAAPPPPTPPQPTLALAGVI